MESSQGSDKPIIIVSLVIFLSIHTCYPILVVRGKHDEHAANFYTPGGLCDQIAALAVIFKEKFLQLFLSNR